MLQGGRSWKVGRGVRKKCIIVTKIFKERRGDLLGGKRGRKRSKLVGGLEEVTANIAIIAR